MRSQELLTLPTCRPQFDPTNEQTMRRTVEQGYQQLRDDIAEVEVSGGKPSSLSLRRFQFLLMGASHG